MKPLSRMLALIALALMLAGCQTVGGWFQRNRPEPPADLVDFDTTIQVERVWSASVGRGLDRSQSRIKPFHADGLIWTADHRGLVLALDVENGRVNRRLSTDIRVSAGPGVYGDLLLLGDFDGGLHGLDPATGAPRWRAQLSSEILSLPVLHDGVVVVRCIDGRVFGLDPADGRRVWVYDRSVPLLTLRGNSDPLVRGGQVYIGYDDGTVSALRVADGSVTWEQRISAPEGRTELERLADIDGQMAMVGTDLYVVTYRGRMAALAAESGRVLWVKDVSSHSGISVERTRLAVSDRDDNIWLVDRRNGATLWRDDRMPRRKLTRPSLLGDHVVIGDTQGYLHWMNAETGAFTARVRPFRDPFSGGPLVIGDRVIVMSADGDLSAWQVRR